MLFIALYLTYCIVGMGDIDILMYDYCKATIITIASTVFTLKIPIKNVKLSINVSKSSTTAHDK